MDWIAVIIRMSNDSNDLLPMTDPREWCIHHIIYLLNPTE